MGISNLLSKLKLLKRPAETVAPEDLAYSQKAVKGMQDIIDQGRPVMRDDNHVSPQVEKLKALMAKLNADALARRREVEVPDFDTPLDQLKKKTGSEKLAKLREILEKRAKDITTEPSNPKVKNPVKPVQPKAPAAKKPIVPIKPTGFRSVQIGSNGINAPVDKSSPANVAATRAALAGQAKPVNERLLRILRSKGVQGVPPANTTAFRTYRTTSFDK